MLNSSAIISCDMISLNLISPKDLWWKPSLTLISPKDLWWYPRWNLWYSVEYYISCDMISLNLISLKDLWSKYRNKWKEIFMEGLDFWKLWSSIESYISCDMISLYLISPKDLWWSPRWDLWSSVESCISCDMISLCSGSTYTDPTSCDRQPLYKWYISSENHEYYGAEELATPF